MQRRADGISRRSIISRRPTSAWVLRGHGRGGAGEGRPAQGNYRMTTTAFTGDLHGPPRRQVARGGAGDYGSFPLDLGTIGASLQTLFGGNITLFSELGEKTRPEAFDMMVDHAIERGPMPSSAYGTTPPRSSKAYRRCCATALQSSWSPSSPLGSADLQIDVVVKRGHRFS